MKIEVTLKDIETVVVKKGEVLSLEISADEAYILRSLIYTSRRAVNTTSRVKKVLEDFEAALNANKVFFDSAMFRTTFNGEANSEWKGSFK